MLSPLSIELKSFTTHQRLQSDNALVIPKCPGGGNTDGTGKGISGTTFSPYML
jgi:hypothetical protein